jgi:hypothetical protein
LFGKTPKYAASGLLGHVTDMESIQIEQAASMRGMGLSEFVRRRALGTRMPAGIVDRQAQAEATTALLRLGVNLNQIAKHVNAGQGVAVGELNALIVRINAEMDNLMRDLDNEDFDSDENV